MAFESDFLTMTASTVTVSPPSTINAFGEIIASTSDAVTYSARIEEEPHEVVNSEGVVQIASGTIFVMSSSASIGLSHVVELPSGNAPELLRTMVLNDDEGQHHVEVHFR